MRALPRLAPLLSLALAAAPFTRAASLDHYLAAAPFKMPILAAPDFPDRAYPITDYGAVPDGRTLATDAFARAIDACARAGGGHVTVPAGLWLTGPIVLKSGVDLHADRGAVIQFTPDHTAYAMVPRPGRGYTAQSCLSARNQTDIAITGEGIFDGAGDTWRPARRSKATDAQWQAMLAKGGAVSGSGINANWWPSKQAMEGEDYLAGLAAEGKRATAEDYLPARDYLRPPLLSLSGCHNVLVSGVTLRNSPSGLFSPSHCTNLIISGATFFNEWWAQNGDGLDIDCCVGVAVYQCTLSTGDDAICMKADGKAPAPGEAGLRDVVVAECTVYHGHGGFVVGGTTEAGMSDLWATRCSFVGSDVGIRIKSGLGHGGLVHDVTVDHIAMSAIANEAISFNTFYDNTPVSAAKVKVQLSRDPAKTPEFRDIRISDVTCFGAGTAISLIGLHQKPLHAITIERTTISARKGVNLVDAADITFRQVQVDATESPKVTQRDTADIRFVE